MDKNMKVIKRNKGGRTRSSAWQAEILTTILSRTYGDVIANIVLYSEVVLIEHFSR